jgi:hypothetical protein
MTHDFYVAFQIPYVYDFITKSCKQQSEVVRNKQNENILNIGQGAAQHKKCGRLKHGGGHACDRSIDFSCLYSKD